MKIDYGSVTKQELLDMECFMPKEPFSSIIIVPTENMHDSGWRCMKFILADGYNIVGVIDGGSDVVSINGIGGYGKDWLHSRSTGMVPRTDWGIDCLPTAQCLRLFSSKYCDLGSDDFSNDIITSTFKIFAREEDQNT